MKKIREFIRLWPDLWSVPVALIALVLSPYFIRKIDPTAATFDLGILQIIVIAAITIMVFSSLVFAGLRWNFPTLFTFYKESTFKEHFQNLNSWQKHLLFALYFLAFLLVFSLVANAVL